MKFYQVKQQMNNLHWHSLGYFKKEEDANNYCKLFNTKVVVYPTKVVEHEFLNMKDFKDELDASNES